MKPKVFIGSSAEGLAYCKAVLVGLNHTAHPTGWYNAFPASSLTLEALEKGFEDYDFGVFILSPDDGLDLRDKKHVIGRDNVLFEAGLFMGMHGRQRTFVLVPRGVPNFHMPTDLLAFTTVEYDYGRSLTDAEGAFAAAVANIESAMVNVHQHEPAVKIHAQVTHHAGATWPLKLWMEIKNTHAVAVTLSSRGFAFGSIGHSAEHAVQGKGEPHLPIFEVGRDKDGNDIHSTMCVIKPGDTVRSWVALDEKVEHKDAVALLAYRKVGQWDCVATWDDRPRPHTHRMRKAF